MKLKTEKELAMELIGTTKFNVCFGMPEAVILDYKEYFADGSTDLKIFNNELLKLGFECVPLEKSELSFYHMQGKYVLQRK